MLSSDALETAIGLTFVFLLISLLCAAVQEWLEGIFKWRAMDLERAVRSLLGDSDGKLTELLYQHPLVFSLFQGHYDPAKLTSSPLTPGSDAMHVRLRARRNLPSYIPSNNFAVALLDLLGRGPVEGGDQASEAAVGVKELRERAPTLASAHLRRVLLAILDQSGDDLDKPRRNVQDWYDSAMDRASGWYKRRTQAVLFTLGILAACVLNVDAIHVMKKLTADHAFRKAIVGEAATTSAKEGTTTERMESTWKQINGLGLPIGWTKLDKAIDFPTPVLPIQLCERSAGSCAPQHAGWPMVLFGWLITAFAVMLGAPFWFDVLNKFMVIRSTVKPKEKSPEEGSEDRQRPPASGVEAPGSAPKPSSPPDGGTTAPSPATSLVSTSFQPNEWQAGYINKHEISI